MSEVIYKPVLGFPGYCVGDDGSVWSCLVTGPDRKKVEGTTWRKLKPAISQGYLRVFLYRGGTKYPMLVQRLVLEAFVGPCPPGKECAHDKNDRSDCRLVNIAWKTRQENADDRVRDGNSGKGQKNPNADLSEAQAREIVARIAAGETKAAVARDFKISDVHAGRIAKGESWPHLQNPVSTPTQKELSNG